MMRNVRRKMFLTFDCPVRRVVNKKWLFCLLIGSVCIASLLSVGGLCRPILHAQGVKPRSFASPEQAIATLVRAIEANDTQGMLSILGAEAKDIVASGDDVADRSAREGFIKLYHETNRMETMDNGRKAVLSVGWSDWPFPIPLTKTGAEWHFDTLSGKQEIINRRIGRNELDVIDLCRTYVQAQREYGSRDWNNDGIVEYARQFISDEGKWNGLYWEAAEDEIKSPLGPLFVEAAAQGYSAKKAGMEPRPFHGYLFRILTAQGSHAPGGAYRYLINGHMVAGFAMIAYPAQYGSSGIMSFIVNQNGRVYQKDLGKKTGVVAPRITVYDPDKTWIRAEYAEGSLPAGL